MQGVGYLIAAYAAVWVGLFAYLAVIAMRIRSVSTELAAVRELLHDQQEENLSHEH
jgi:CcmD family protein